MSNLSEDYENTIVDILHAEDRDPDWLVPDLLLQGGLFCWAGLAAAGKSYLSYLLGLAVASGSPALSGIVPAGQPRTVLYFDQENGLQDRDTYLRRSWHGLAYVNKRAPDVGLLHKHFHPIHLQLGDRREWADTVEAYVEFIKPHMVVFDTAISAFDIEDENSNSEAMTIINKLRLIQQITEPVATMVVLKHASSGVDKDKVRRMRGATVWQSQVDGVIFQVKAKGRPRADGLSKTMLSSTKTRAHGLSGMIEISPKWTDAHKTGLALTARHLKDTGRVFRGKTSDDNEIEVDWDEQ